MGKLVSEAFRETHEKEWRKSNPPKVDIIQQIRDTYRSEVRWEKAIQHRREAGELDESPRDIGPLLQGIQQDIKEECREEISGALFDAFWKEISRGTVAGFPQWYKDRLAEQQFSSAGGE